MASPRSARVSDPAAAPHRRSPALTRSARVSDPAAAPDRRSPALTRSARVSDPAAVPDRRSPAFATELGCKGIQASRAYTNGRRPSVDNLGGVGRPAPNGVNLGGVGRPAPNGLNLGGVGRPAPNGGWGGVGTPAPRPGCLRTGTKRRKIETCHPGFDSRDTCTLAESVLRTAVGHIVTIPSLNGWARGRLETARIRRFGRVCRSRHRPERNPKAQEVSRQVIAG
jgi:hypothetical protein